MEFLVLSAISHSPFKLFKVQSSKAYGKSGAAKDAPAAPEQIFVVVGRGSRT